MCRSSVLWTTRCTFTLGFAASCDSVLGRPQYLIAIDLIISYKGMKTVLNYLSTGPGPFFVFSLSLFQFFRLLIVLSLICVFFSTSDIEDRGIILTSGQAYGDASQLYGLLSSSNDSLRTMSFQRNVSYILH